MAQTKRPGRPLTFNYEARENFANLIRMYGARGAREVSDVPVSVETLLKIAREFDIPLKKGRLPEVRRPPRSSGA
jgi:hypothetical protein